MTDLTEMADAMCRVAMKEAGIEVTQERLDSYRHVALACAKAGVEVLEKESGPAKLWSWWVV